MFSLIGHRDTYRELCGFTRARAAGRGVLLSGPEGIGKKQLALAWSAHLLCTGAKREESNFPCGACAACVQVERRSSPDLLFIEASKGSIAIAKIREAKAWGALTPFYGKKKILLIDDAHTLQKGAANALLKLLEEPGPDLFIALVTSLPSRLSETLRSRCLHFRCRAPAWGNDLEDFFREKIPDCNPMLVKDWYHLSFGNIGSLLSGTLKEWDELRQLLSRLLFSRETLASLVETKDWLPVLAGKKGQAGLVFDLIANLLRDAWHRDAWHRDAWRQDAWRRDARHGLNSPFEKGGQGGFGEAWLQHKAEVLGEARRRYREVLNQELFWEDFCYSWCEKK